MAGYGQRYSKEFKYSAIQLVLNNEKSVLKLSVELGVHEKTLYGWVNKYKKEHNLEVKTLTKKKSSNESLEEENRRLRKEYSQIFSIKRMCLIIGVSRSCYYHWLRINHQADVELNELVKDIFIGSRTTYGTRRIKKKLEQLYGLVISCRRIGYIMKKLDLNTRNKRRFITMRLLQTV